MNFKIAQKLPASQFKRRFGVKLLTFKHLVKALKPFWRATPKAGAKPKLALAERVLVCLEYWREYRTQGEFVVHKNIKMMDKPVIERKWKRA